MKLLFDQNLSPKLVEIFNHQFHDSRHVQSLAFGESEDIKLWDYAKENNYTLVTKDSDFNNMVSLYGFPPKVIWIKKGNCSTRQIEELLNKQIVQIFSFISDSENGILILT